MNSVFNIKLWKSPCLSCQPRKRGGTLHGRHVAYLGRRGRSSRRHDLPQNVLQNRRCHLRILQPSAVAGDPAAQIEEVLCPEDMLAELASELPIGEVLPALVDSLEQAPNLVLRAPPGTGKTTVVPLAPLLHGSPWLGPKQRILVLEPRRLAARAAAVRLAANLCERVGDAVGYRTRLERRVGPNARVEVITTGVLLRRLQRDRALKGVAAVILDEFHERSVEADLALALCLDCQKRLRPDLRLVVMSATLGDDLAERLVRIMSSSARTTQSSQNGSGPTDSEGAESASGSEQSTSDADPAGGCRLLTCEGRMFPVRTKYLGAPGREHMDLEKAAAAAVMTALKESPSGDVLVFLPGAAEIRRTQQALVERVAKSVRVLPLYSALPLAQQDAAIRLDPEGARRVVLATSIAETSLTIEGVRAVVDSGLARVPVQDIASGLTRLATVAASLASADQRRGRAGRTGPGVCYRLWSEAAHAKLAEASPPEILSADLAPLALQLASWREDQPDGVVPDLEWLDAPPAEGLERAVALLQSLGAVDANGCITPEGRSMAALGEHPRLARMVLTSARLRCEPLGCMLAALISEGDFLRGPTLAATADVWPRVRILLDPAGSPALQAALAPILKAAERLLQGLANERDTLADTLPNLGTPATALETDPKQSKEAAGNTPPPGAQQNGGSEAQLSPDQARSAPLPDQDKSAPAPDQAARQEAEVGTFRAVIESQLSTALPGVLIAVAYPERIAQRQSRGNRDRPGYMMANGASVRLPGAGDPLAGEDLLAVAAAGGLRGGGRSDSISLAAPLDAAALEEAAPQLLRSRARVFWAPGAKAVAGRHQRCIGEIILEEEPMEVSDEQALPVLIEALCGSGTGPLAALKLPDQALTFRQRVTWLRKFSTEHLQEPMQAQAAAQTVHDSSDHQNTYTASDSGTAAVGTYAEQGSGPNLEQKLQAAAALPDLSDAALAADVVSWLQPHLTGVRSLAQAQSLDWEGIFRSLLDEEQQRIVDDLAPAALQLPDGSAAAIDYSHDPPSVAKAPTAEEVPEKMERHFICEGLVKLHVQQELKAAEAVSGRRAASKAPKGKKKRGRK